MKQLVDRLDAYGYVMQENRTSSLTPEEERIFIAQTKLERLSKKMPKSSEVPHKARIRKRAPRKQAMHTKAKVKTPMTTKLTPKVPNAPKVKKSIIRRYERRNLVPARLMFGRGVRRDSKPARKCFMCNCY